MFPGLSGWGQGSFEREGSGAPGCFVRLAKGDVRAGRQA